MKLFLFGCLQFVLLLFAGQEDCLGQVQSDTTAGNIIPGSLLAEVHADPIIERRFVKYFIGKRKLGTREVSDILSCADSTYFLRFNKATANFKTGGQIAIVGGGLITAGSIAAIAYTFNAVFNSTSDNSSADVANFFLITGSVATLTGLAIMTNTKIKKNSIVNEYNGMVRRKNRQVGLYLKTGINRISIALKF